MASNNATRAALPYFPVAIGVWWSIWGAKGFWWGLWYGGFWPVWFAYHIAALLYR